MFDDSKHQYLAARLRRTRHVLMGDKWVTTTDPLNPDGPEAALVLEAMIKDIRALMLKNRTLENELREANENVNALNKSLKEAQQIISPNGKPLPLEENADYFTSRAYNCLQNINLKNLNQLKMVTKSELAAVPNLGRKTLREIEEIMAEFGLKFATKPSASTDVIRRSGYGITFRRG
jgi:DNA-directed RNA polymerase alpha subunit